MEQLKNGLNLIYFDDLEHNAEVESIKQQAKAICDARRQNAKPLMQAKNDTFVGLVGLENAVRDIKTNIGTFSDSQDTTNAIIVECDKILSSIPEFKKAAEILCSRLNEGKIRIVSIGEKSQGKSLFTQIYTHIEEGSKILKVKDSNDVDDCTGAVNTFHHKDNQSVPLIEVEFLSLEDIKNVLLSYISDIQQYPQYKTWTIAGLSNISTKQDLINIVSDANNLALINALSNIPSDTKKGIKQYFSHGTEYIRKLGISRQSISEDEIEQYNDMQNPLAYYLAVDNISITLDLGMNGLFEYFEVADTKGASLEAGTLANKNIFKVIDESDAVFSIAKANQTQTWKFYNEALGSKYRGDAVFKDKHFAIINLDENFGRTAAKTGVDVLDDQNLSHYCYIGRLREDKNTDSCDPSAFVQDLIVHMLGKIASNITKFDNERIKTCRLSGDAIKDALLELRKLLDKVKYQKFDEKQLVKDKIREFCNIARTYINSQIDQINLNDDEDTDEEENYNLYYKEVTNNDENNRYASLYEVLTGKKYTKNFPTAFDEDKDVELYDAVDDLLKIVNEKSRIKENMNNEVHVGEYVDSLSGAMVDEIWPRLFERRIQHPITFKKRDELFDELWKIFKLDIIFAGCPIWASDCVDKTDKLRIINKVYNEGINEQFQSGKSLFTSYTILSEYFNVLRHVGDEDEDTKKESRLDENLLHKAFENEIGRLKIREAIIDRIKTYPKAIKTFYEEARTAINTVDANAHSSDDDFYFSHISQIASETDQQKLLDARLWDQVSVSVSKVKQYEFENIPLIKI